MRYGGDVWQKYKEDVFDPLNKDRYVSQSTNMALENPGRYLSWNYTRV
jgi:hypothetical protein